MNLTLLWVSIGLIVVGFLINLYGGWMRSKESGALGAHKTLLQLIEEAVQKLFTSLQGALKPGATVGEKVESFGSAVAFLGLAVFILFIIVNVTGGQKSTATPTPGASASPS
jgi:hypothetical protein